MNRFKNFILLLGLFALALPATAQVAAARPDCKCPVSHQVGDTITVDGVVEYVSSVSITEHCPEGANCDDSKCKFKFRSKPRGNGLSTLHKRTADCQALTAIWIFGDLVVPHKALEGKEKDIYPIIETH